VRVIVRHYRAEHRQRAAAELEWYGAMPLPEAIAVAAAALTRRGKRHPHQTRIPGAALSAAERRLLAVQREIAACRDFETLLVRVESALAGIAGLGELYRYDTAHRIGAALGVEPEEVYLHRGTRAGAVRLGFDGRRRSLAMSELPRALRILEPHEVEDVLCIYKARFVRHPPSGAGD